MTHDYKRNGTTTLFAALNVLDGTVIGKNMQRHRHQEFIRFLNSIDAEVPTGKAVHVALDNYAAHKHPKVRAWLNRHQLQRRRGLLRQAVEATPQATRLSICCRPAGGHQPPTIDNPNPSPGPPTPKSSPPSNVGTKCQIQSTLMIADDGLWRRNWPAEPDRRSGYLYGGYDRRDLNVGQQSLIRGSGRMSLFRLGLPLMANVEAHSGDEGSPALFRLQRRISHRG